VLTGVVDVDAAVVVDWVVAGGTRQAAAFCSVARRSCCPFTNFARCLGFLWLRKYAARCLGIAFR